MSTQNTEVRSSEIRALLNDTPSWYMKWGTAFIFLAVISMGAVSWFFKYPDIVIADLVILSSNPPVPVISPIKGLLDEIFVKEGEDVKAGDVLAVFTIPGANYEDIEFLQAKLDVFNASDPETFAEFEKYIDDPADANDQLKLGSVRPAFNEFIVQLRTYAFESAGSQNSQKRADNEDKINRLKKEILDEKKRIPGFEDRLYLKIETEKIEEARYLGDNTITDTKPWRDAKNAVSDAQAELDNLKSSIAYKESQVIQLGKENKNLAASTNTDIARILNEIIVKQENLVSEVKKWRQKYLLFAPLDGKVSFYQKKDGKQKLYFEEGDKVIAILGVEKGVYVGQVKLKKEDNGKVVEGDKVLMKLPSFPYQRYGKLRGEVAYIPKVEDKGHFAVQVRLPNDTLKTTFGKIIPIDQKLFGTAEIITEEKRLFHRIYEHLF